MAKRSCGALNKHTNGTVRKARSSLTVLGIRIPGMITKQKETIRHFSSCTEEIPGADPKEDITTSGVA